MVAVVGFLVAMVDGYDTLMLAFIAPLISKEWGLLPQMVGQIFASSYPGAALGATAIGIAADRFSGFGFGSFGIQKIINDLKSKTEIVRIGA